MRPYIYNFEQMKSHTYYLSNKTKPKNTLRINRMLGKVPLINVPHHICTCPLGYAGHNGDVETMFIFIQIQSSSPGITGIIKQ